MNNEKKFIKLTPFKMQVLQTFPFIDADFDAITNYELLCKVVEYLNTTVDNVNLLESDFKVLYDYVHDYFDNLDVQREINNKLDEMARSGELQEIIGSYLNSNAIFSYDNVSLMKKATNLIDGSFTRTLGFYNKNDYGASFYKIRNKTELDIIDEKTIIELDNTLIAELLINESMCVNQFGAKGNGIDDDTIYINKAFSNNNVANYIFAPNSVYMVKGFEENQAQGGTNGLLETTGLIVHSNSNINLNYSTIKIITNNRQNYHGFTIKNVENVVLKNGYIIGDSSTHLGSTGEWGYGIAIMGSKNITLESLNITKCWGDGINLNNSTGTSGSDNYNIFINNCVCDDNRRQGMSIESIKGIVVTNSKFINTGFTSYTAPSSGVDIEPASANICEDIKFDNCTFSNNRRSGLIVTNSSVINHIELNNCKLINNMVGNESINDHGNLSIVRGQYINIKNCTIGNTDKITNLYLRTLHSGTSNEHNYFNIENNIIYNSHILVRPINSDYTDFNFINNTLSANINMNTYFIQVETNTGYTDNNKNVNLNFYNNKFKINKENSVLSYIFCNNYLNSGISKINIKNNVFCYGDRHLQIGVPCIIENNDFILSKTVGILLLGGNADNSIYIIKDNIFEYPNSGNSSLGIIEDYPTTYYIYAIRNIVLKDKLLNNFDIIDNPTIHESDLRMFVYSRTNSINESNNIY